MSALTAERLREVLAYDPETGAFTWRVKRGSRALAGATAGCCRTAHRGSALHYVAIAVYGRRYLAHRLAWLWVTGDWPPAEIDHVDGDGTNNAWVNLRAATRSQNSRNRTRAKNNKSGIKGVQVQKSRCGDLFVAAIGIDRRKIYLGTFTTAERARAAYCAAAQRYHGEFARLA